MSDVAEHSLTRAGKFYVAKFDPSPRACDRLGQSRALSAAFRSARSSVGLFVR
jgi:hypothetical protein